jgi:hypothetical protein
MQVILYFAAGCILLLLAVLAARLPLSRLARLLNCLLFGVSAGVMLATITAVLEYAGAFRAPGVQLAGVSVTSSILAFLLGFTAATLAAAAVSLRK